jgi:SAM-dependent methyltransferase
MSSDSLAMKVVSRPRRGVSFLLAIALASIVFILVLFGWLLLFVVIAPVLLLSGVLGWPGKSRQSRSAAEGATDSLDSGRDDGCSRPDQPLIFDRRKDVSKLFGCNTRSVQYRWDLFSNRLQEIKANRTELRALDFGAGSLRDSYELIKQGFSVVSMDLDPAVMQQYLDSYDWTALGSQPRLFTESIARLSESVSSAYFDLAISFDVIEHLEHPEEYLQGLRPLLREDGYLFAIVPNRRSIYERYFKYSLRRQKENGAPGQPPGVPHLQFKSPDEWDRFIEANDFEIVAHDMAIGPLVNDVWHGMLALPIRVFVAPVLLRLAHALKVSLDATKLETRFTPPWLMAAVDVWDQFLKRHTKGRFGWNLIIARRKNNDG